jgi:hypothetical protein
MGSVKSFLCFNSSRILLCKGLFIHGGQYDDPNDLSVTVAVDLEATVYLR